MQTSSLPYLDEHTATIEADAEDVWLGLLRTLDRTFSRPHSAGYARLVRCADQVGSGPRPLTEGSTIPGFHVVTAVPGSELGLEGRHRFSTYALTFRLDRIGPDRTRLRAESRAAFPGLGGGVYRMLLLRTGGHVFAMRRLLSAVASRSV